jgi:hypothetical protein
MIDETAGAIWKIPESSIGLSHTHPNVSVPSKSWLNFIENAKRDAYTFVNAEVVLDLQRHVQDRPPTPAHVLLATESTETTPRVVYTQSVTIFHPHFRGYASTFHWALSFEQHTEVFAQAQRTDSRQLLELGEPVAPKLSSLYHQRPCPSAVQGATRVVDFASEITACEREFFVSVSCAPYLFRDCSSTLEQYWRSTRLHKEHFPSRMALKNRIGREAELRKLRSVHMLLEKARDPTIEKRVLENATNGMKVLNDLMDVTNVCAKRIRIAYDSPPVSEGRPTTAFFGDDGLPHEIQSKILLMGVQAAFSNPDCRAAHCQFASIRSTCSAFRTEATLLGDQLVTDAMDDLQRFVSTGCSRRTEIGSSWVYRELACPPSMLLRGIAERKPSDYHDCLVYMQERMRANLSANICKERGKAVPNDGNDALRPRSARLDRLLKIAYEVESV